ncbi:hypothetical protein SCFA_410002 [anaerobic digester metagenome]|jgi:hypothetical protein|uniref:Uncharacterized protein n=1 Tax=anaerobic digester metagenome TaxID=1263854 RepID=A0A485M4H4_9ZZZZ
MSLGNKNIVSPVIAVNVLVGEMKYGQVNLPFKLLNVLVLFDH